MSVDYSDLVSDGAGKAAAEIYAKHGITCVRGLLPSCEIATLRDEFTKHVESHDNLIWKVHDKIVDENIAKDDILKRYPRYSMPHRHEDMVPGQLARRYITDKRIFDIAENLIGATWAAQSMYYFKPPTARGQALHQDNFFLQSHPETCLAAWIAVDDADAENGALQVVPGSHNYAIACPEDADPQLSFSTQALRIPANFVKLQTELKAGDVLFFHGSLIHGSLPNTSKDRFRRSLIFHYIPQGSREVARFYQPLLTREGDEINIGQSIQGGECGTAWPEGGA